MMISTLGWFLGYGFVAAGCRRMWRDAELEALLFGIRRERQALLRAVSLFQELEETLSAGLLPAAERWQALKALPDPWGKLSFESLQELRSHGGSLIPTLKRLRQFAQDHVDALDHARAKSSQALAQAIASAGLVPLFGGILYYLLPGVADSPWIWTLVCATALLMASVGALWMLRMTETARWCGIPPSKRHWVLSVQCAGERFIALLRAGTPADLAWNRACEGLAPTARDLVLQWGLSVWSDGGAGAQPERSFTRNPALAILVEFGSSVRRAIQTSVMEGRPCLERVESTLGALKLEIRAQIERELTLLATRALKPLFLCVAPALLGLLASGLALSFLQAGAGLFG